jgi:hypothetical protein
MAKRVRKSAPATPRARPSGARYYIVKLATFEGEDTAFYLLGADPMWIVISVRPGTGASIVDCGYRSLADARKAWPEALSPGAERRPRDRRARLGWDRVPPVFAEPWFQEFWRKAKRASLRAAGG